MFSRFQWKVTTAISLIAVVCIVFGITRFTSPKASLLRATAPILELPDFSESVQEIDTSVFIKEERANEVWVSASNTAKAVSGTVVAGVVNHHALAANLIADFFANLRASRPGLKRIVIISPDHFKVGRGEVSTHARPYRVGTMSVQIDEDAVHDLIDSSVATMENGNLFEQEHGIGVLVPFVVRAYPDIKIVPIAFRGDMSKQSAKRLSDALKGLWNDETAIIISADMSHYLFTDISLQHDIKTLEQLKTRDESIASLTDAYIDSGKSMGTLFSAMNAIHPSAEFVLFDHAVSSDYGADPNQATTYMTGVWKLDDFPNSP